MDSSAPPDVFVPTVTVPIGTHSHLFDNLAPMNTYFFYITALDKGQPAFLGDVLESTPSSILSGFPTASTAAPTAPSNLGAVSIATNSITWQWIDNADSEDGFYIYASTGGLVGSAASSPGSGAAVQFVEANLIPGAAYARTVTAFNAYAQSLPSGATSRYTLPNPPVGTAVASAFISSVAISWNANQNDPSALYEIQRTSSASFGQVDFSTMAAGTIFMDTGLAGSATYYYRIRAQNGEGVQSAFDGTVSTRTLPSRVLALRRRRPTAKSL